MPRAYNFSAGPATLPEARRVQIICGGVSIRMGHGVRRPISMRGTAENGCGAGTAGLTNRRPSQ